MKLKVFVSIGLVGCTREAIIDVPDSDLEGAGDAERASIFDDYTREWAMDRCEWGWSFALTRSMAVNRDGLTPDDLIAWQQCPQISFESYADLIWSMRDAAHVAHERQRRSLDGYRRVECPLFQSGLPPVVSMRAVR